MTCCFVQQLAPGPLICTLTISLCGFQAALHASTASPSAHLSTAQVQQPCLLLLLLLVLLAIVPAP
jgi:hypothetical protein